MTELTPAALTRAICEIALAAGATIMAVYGRPFEMRRKADSSPVTDADEAAERLIIEALTELTPDIPIVAEESVALGRVPDISGGRFWLVDPLDGTKEFISRNGEFTVNLALIVDRVPILGVVHCPAISLTFCASGPDEVFRQAGGGAPEPIRARAPSGGLVTLVSRSHRGVRTDEFLATLDIASISQAGSSLKFCQVAAGEADLYPRFGRTFEWDTAAGHAILAAAGGSLRSLDGADLAYAKPGFENPDFLARGRDA